MKKTKLSLIISSTIVLAACGGSGDDNVTTPDTGLNYHIDGKAMVGYINAATVFLDLNYNGQWDNNEPKTLTRDDGRFYLELDNTQNACRDTAPLVFHAQKGLIDSDNGEIEEDFYLTLPPTLLMSQNGTKSFNITPLTDLTWDAYAFKGITDCSNVNEDMLNDYYNNIQSELEAGAIAQIDGVESVADIYSDYKKTNLNIDSRELLKIQQSNVQAKKENAALNEADPLNTMFISYKYFDEFNDLVKLEQDTTTTIVEVDSEDQTTIRESKSFYEIDTTTYQVIDDLKTEITENYLIDNKSYTPVVSIDILAYKNSLSNDYTCYKNEKMDVTYKATSSGEETNSNQYTMNVSGKLENVTDLDNCINEQITPPLDLGGTAINSPFEEILFKVMKTELRYTSAENFESKNTYYGYSTSFDYDQFWELKKDSDDNDYWEKRDFWFDDVWIYHDKHETNVENYYSAMDSFTYEVSGEHSEMGSYTEIDETGTLVEEKW